MQNHFTESDTDGVERRELQVWLADLQLASGEGKGRTREELAARFNNSTRSFLVRNITRRAGSPRKAVLVG
jgi:hypothetical protein